MAKEYRKVGDRTYVYEYKSVRQGKKVKRIFKGYLGVLQEDGQIVKPNKMIDRVKLSRSKTYGDVAILWKLSQELGISEILDNIFSRKREESFGSLAMIYVINKTICPTSLNELPYWYFRTALDEITGIPVEHVTKDRILTVIRNVGHDEIIWKIEKELFQRNKPELGKGLLYDITSTYFYGKCCILAELGYNRDKNNEKQVNIALVTNMDGYPLFHFVYRGSIMDSRTGGKFLDILHSFGIKEVSIIWDRGISTFTNIKWAREDNLEVIGGLRKDSLEFKKFVALNDDLEKPEFFVKPIENGALYAKNYQDKLLGKPCNLVLCLNTFARSQQMTSKMIKLKKMRDQLIELDGAKKNKVAKKIESVSKEIEQQKNSYGKFLLFSTNTELSSFQVVQTYFAKDAVEKAFRILKQDIELHPVQYRKVEHVKGYFFVCFLAYLLRIALQNKLEKHKIEMKVKEALKKMNEVERTRIKLGSDEKARIMNIGEDQKQIIDKLGLKDLFPVEPLMRV